MHTHVSRPQNPHSSSVTHLLFCYIVFYIHTPRTRNAITPPSNSCNCLHPPKNPMKPQQSYARVLDLFFPPPPIVLKLLFAVSNFYSCSSFASVSVCVCRRPFFSETVSPLSNFYSSSSFASVCLYTPSFLKLETDCCFPVSQFLNLAAFFFFVSSTTGSRA